MNFEALFAAKENGGGVRLWIRFSPVLHSMANSGGLLSILIPHNIEFANINGGIGSLFSILKSMILNIVLMLSNCLSK